MNYAFSSPLKAIQGPAIKDLTAAQFGPPKIARSPTPRERLTDLSHPSSTSSKLSTISVPTKPKYIPNQRPPPEVHGSRPNDAIRQNEGSPKIIISRFLLVNGGISFRLGAQIDGVVTPDTEEVPLAKILDHVSPAELERFENQDFFDEDERERLLPPKKSRGRPRKDDTIVPSFNVAPLGDETSREHSLLPEGKILKNKKKRGRSKGIFRNVVDSTTSTKLSVHIGPSTAIKKRRGRPPRQKNLSVVIPSFNGPQPQKPENNSGARSDSEDVLENPKPQYSMIAASGLGQSDTEAVTSRDQSVELVPSSKRRRLDAKTAFIDLSLNDDDNDERASHRTKRTKTSSEMSPDPIADDSIALLRQFQARVYGPDRSEKDNSIPHRQPQANLTLGGLGHSRPRLSSLGSSSSDLSMGPKPQPLKSLPTKSVPSEPRPEESSLHQLPPRVISTVVPCHPMKTTPTKPTSPNRIISRKVSLTPHFPPSTNFGHSKSTNIAAKKESHPSIPPVNRHIPPKSNLSSTQTSSRIIPAGPKKGKPSSQSRSTPSQSSQTPKTSRIGFAGLPRAKDITDYFAPKSTPTKPPTPPPRAYQTPHSPAAQLLGAQANNKSDGDSDSEDQLARVSSTGSMNSEIVVVRSKHPHNTSTNNNNPATTTTAAAATSRDPSHTRPRTNPTNPSSSHSSSKDKHDPATTTAAPIQPPSTSTSSSKIHNSAESPEQAFEIEEDEDDDDDDDGNSDNTDSDSSGSEVMVIRPT